MRRRELHVPPSFALGFMAGLAAAGVSVLMRVAVRRARARARARHEEAPLRFIDLEPDDELVLQARPGEEANSCEPPRLESELPEFSPLSQRW